MWPWACFDRLQEGLRLLRHYVAGLDSQDRLLSLSHDACGEAAAVLKQLQDHYRGQNNKAQYDYNTIIVSLYGYLERYIEDLIGEHLTLLMSFVPQFSGLPSVVQERHLQLSVDLVRKADYQKYASNLRVEDIVAKLHACFTNPDQYQLNIQAFAQHTATFRQPVVNETFSQCGITGLAQSLRHAEPFVSFLRGEDPERDLNTYLAKDDDVVFSRLNDLATRRNDVAHGSPVDDILSRDILRTYVDFIEAYAAALALVVHERTLPFMLVRAIPLGRPLAVYDSRIVCLNFPAGHMALGDTLIAKTHDTRRPYKAGPIREIQRNHVPLDTVTGGPDVQIGLRIDFSAKDNQHFFHLPSQQAVAAQ